MKVSVVVPVRNEAQSIRTLLDSLLSQTRVPDEIVITDGGSTDSTTQIIDEYISRGAPVRLIREQAALPGRGRNVSAANASYDWLAFTDGGIRPARDWLQTLIRNVEQDSTLDVVYGTWEPVVDTFFRECAAIAYVVPPEPVDGATIRKRVIASTLMRKSVWSAVGGFPEDLRSAEDLVFMNAIEQANFHVLYEPRAIVQWSIQPTFGRTFKRFALYSGNNIRAGLWGKWQGPVFRRYLVVGFWALVAIALGRQWLFTIPLVWLLMLAARAVVALRRNALTYPATVWRNARRLLLLIPIIATLDAATFVGTINWLLSDKLTSTKRA